MGGKIVGYMVYGLVRGIAYLVSRPNGYDTVDENGHPGEDSEVPSEPKAYPASTIYRSGESAAYVYFPSRLDENGHRRDFGAPRTAELSVGGFMNVQEQVYSTDFSVRRWFRLVEADLAWERFFEPRSDTHGVDTLDMFHLRLGINLLGPHVTPIELYAVVGASGMSGFGNLTPAFDAGLEVRAYPFRPFVFYNSTVVSIFADGPPLIDGRFEAGISVGRFDFRAGIRGLKQEPAQSFLGPVATIAMRL